MGVRRYRARVFGANLKRDSKNFRLMRNFSSGPLTKQGRSGSLILGSCPGGTDWKPPDQPPRTERVPLLFSGIQSSCQISKRKGNPGRLPVGWLLSVFLAKPFFHLELVRMIVRGVK